MKVNNKSAKDTAFEKERNKLKKEIRLAKEESISKDNEIDELKAEISKLKLEIVDRNGYIRSLLDIISLSQEELLELAEKDESKAISLVDLNFLLGGGAEYVLQR